MAEPKESREACPNCGAQVREHTSFCYSCGTDIKNPITDIEPEQPTEADKALEDLADKLSTKPERDDDAIAKAAKERRKARVSQRKLRQYVWEPYETPSLLILWIVVAVCLVVSSLAVYAVLFVR
jgi:hypothetical protein